MSLAEPLQSPPPASLPLPFPCIRKVNSTFRSSNWKYSTSAPCFPPWPFTDYRSPCPNPPRSLPSPLEHHPNSSRGTLLTCPLPCLSTHLSTRSQYSCRLASNRVPTPGTLRSPVPFAWNTLPPELPGSLCHLVRVLVQMSPPRRGLLWRCICNGHTGLPVYIRSVIPAPYFILIYNTHHHRPGGMLTHSLVGVFHTSPPMGMHTSGWDLICATPHCMLESSIGPRTPWSFIGICWMCARMTQWVNKYLAGIGQRDRRGCRVEEGCINSLMLSPS